MCPLTECVSLRLNVSEVDVDKRQKLQSAIVHHPPQCCMFSSRPKLRVAILSRLCFHGMYHEYQVYKKLNGPSFEWRHLTGCRQWCTLAQFNSYANLELWKVCSLVMDQLKKKIDLTFRQPHWCAICRANWKDKTEQKVVSRCAVSSCFSVLFTRKKAS